MFLPSKAECCRLAIKYKSKYNTHIVAVGQAMQNLMKFL